MVIAQIGKKGSRQNAIYAMKQIEADAPILLKYAHEKVNATDVNEH